MDQGSPVLTALRFLTRTGLVDYNGHASIRHGDGFIINSGASNRAAPVAADLATVSLDGTTDGPRPPNEWPLHAEIYRARPDVMAVVHGHPRWLTALSSTGAALAPVMPQAALVHDLPIYPHAHSVHSPERGAAVAAALGPARGVILAGHGLVMTGGDIIAACVLALYAEQTAERMVMAAPLGGAHPLTDAEVAEYRRILDTPGLFAKAWAFHLTME